MLMSKQDQFSSAQAVTASAASTNLVDTGVTSADRLGAGTPLAIVLQVDTAVTSTGSATVAVTLQSHEDADFGSSDTVATCFTIAATAAIGTRYIYAIPPGLTYERYLRLYYTVSAGSLSTGAFTAWISPLDGIQSNDANLP